MVKSLSASVPSIKANRGSRPAVGLFMRMALQNLMRRPTRTLMLILAVALATGAVFASFTVARGIEASMEQSFARMGADLIVVPESTMVNITSALLTVQPTDAALDFHTIDKISHLDGVAQVAPQTIYRVPIMSGMPEHKTNIIAFDPKRDFTVLPWLEQKLPRPMQTGDLICGYRRCDNLGDEVHPCGEAANIYGKLGKSCVGPFDESLFATYDTVAQLTHDQPADMACQPAFGPERVSAVLVRLKFGATPEQIRFAIAQLPGIKVIAGTRIVTSTRQTTTALLTGMVGFTAMMLLASLILLSLLFSAVISERQRELGLLRAIGTRRGNVVQMLLCEASFATGFGGVCGIAFGCCLLLVFQHSLIYFLETMHVDFAWPALPEIVIAASICVGLAIFVGLLGAALPAWWATGKEAYSLIQGEDD